MKKTTRKLLTSVAVVATMALSLTSGIITNAAEEFDYDSYAELENSENETYEYVHRTPGYFEDQYGNWWEFYKVYEVKQGKEFDDFVVEHGDAIGVVCKLYEGEKDPNYVLPYNDELYTHDTEGTFTYNGVEYQYDITPNVEMNSNIRWALYRKILGYVLPDDDLTNSQLIQKYDYKKDGKIDIADVVIFNKRYMSSPFRFCAKYDEELGELKCMDFEEFYKILDWHYMNLEDQFTIRFGDTVPDEPPKADTNTSLFAADSTANSAVELVETAKATGISQIAFAAG